jgi:short-subunit dehydrogenase
MNVVITGASKGLGKAFAAAFAAGGHRLFLCARTGRDLEETAAELRKTFPGVSVFARPFDLSTTEGANAFGSWIQEEGQPVDVLINNAGRFISGRISDEPQGTLEAMIDTNLYSAYHVTRSLLPAMIQRRKGHIFTICSVASLQAYPNGGAYGISKFALLGFSRNLREEMKPYGIKVTAVLPGGTDTPSWDGAGVESQRLMAAEDVAAMVCAAASLSDRADVEDIIMRPQLGDL